MHFILFILLLIIPNNAHAKCENCTHGLSMFGELKYPEDFTHFDYTDENAKKGGDIHLATIGTFDNLNSHILKGVAASGLGYLYDSLLVSSDDEPFSKYGLLAEYVELYEGGVTFYMRKEAKWHDGVPLTADDVVFSFETLTTKGHPFYRTYYQDITAAEKIDDHTVKFTFANNDNRELPLIIGEMPILPKHYYEKHDFAKTTLTAPLGSGAYKVDSVDAGKWIRYKRVEDYWGKDLPVNKGKYNFNTITYDYYRDATVAVEAFKAGKYDFREENISKVWANSYNIPAVKDGRIIKEEIKHSIPTGMQAFVFNTRRAKFSDPKVREALSYAFDFEWTNRSLFYNAYTRTKSYFSNSDFASDGLPEGKELEILEPYRKQLPSKVFTEEYSPPKTNGSGNNRKNLLKARELLKEAGWFIIDGLLYTSPPASGGEKRSLLSSRPFKIEFLLSSKSFERVVAPVVKNLKKLGITATIRIVDPAQYIKRIEDFDFDIVVNVFGQSNSPGNEQINYWHSSRADVKGSRNIAGIKDPVVDALVEKIVSAKDKETLIATTKALDRVLLHSHYVIPNWHLRHFRVIYWNKFSRPEILPKYSLGFDTWWISG